VRRRTHPSRRNLLLHGVGVGGAVLPFVGIRLIDLLVSLIPAVA